MGFKKQATSSLPQARSISEAHLLYHFPLSTQSTSSSTSTVSTLSERHLRGPRHAPMLRLMGWRCPSIVLMLVWTGALACGLWGDTLVKPLKPYDSLGTG